MSFQELPPSYASCVAEAAPAMVEHPPPPFSLTPGTLVLSPRTLTIHSPIAGARAIYQLSSFSVSPSSPPHTALHLLDVPASTTSSSSGDTLYSISLPSSSLSQKHKTATTTVLVKGGGEFGEVQLHKKKSHHHQHHHHYGSLFSSRKPTWEAFSADEEQHPRILYRTQNGGREWHDGGGTLVALETSNDVDKDDEERLEIMVALDKRHLDLIVALWTGRMVQEAAEAAERAQNETRRPPHGVLHRLKKPGLTSVQDNVRRA